MAERLLLRSAAVPRALVAAPGRFGGRPEGDLLLGDLLLDGGRAEALLPHGAAAEGAREADLGGRIVIPRLAEAHCHLDKCHTIGRLGAVGGDLMAAIAAQERDKARWDAADVRARAARGLDELARAGCGAARTHVDWPEECVAAGRAPLAWGPLGELAAERAPQIALQRSALMSLGAFADRAAAGRAADLVAESPGAALGVFLLDQPEKRGPLRAAIELAAERGLPLDFHVDEGLGPGLDGLLAIAGLVAELRPGVPVLCGHACSLADLEGDALARAVAIVAESGVAVVSLPATNLYLQGRRAGTPDRRGITRARELAAAGVPLAFGSDNVGDAFCPLGAHDPLAALALGALAAHLDPPYGRWLPAVTTDARRALGMAPLHVDGAPLADLLACDAPHTAALVAGAARRPLGEAIGESAF